MKRYVVILALLGLVSTSCNSKLDIAPPNRITDEEMQAVLDKKLDVITSSLSGGLESRIWSGKPNATVELNTFGTYNLAQSLRANDLVYAFSSQSWNRPIYRFQDYREEQSGSNAMWWQALYADISAANQVLKYLPAEKVVEEVTLDPALSTDAQTAQKKYQQTLMINKARALTLRAYSYVYLMWVYADDYLHGGSGKLGIPYFTVYEPDNKDRQPIARSSQEESWNKIIADATLAVKLLKNGDKAFSAGTEDFDAVVANTVLMRAAITAGKWDLVISTANDILALLPANKLMTEANYVTTDLKTGNGFTQLLKNTEAIFMSSYSRNGSLSNFNGWMNIYGDTGYGGSRGGFMAIDARLYDQIAPDDYRKKNFLSEDLGKYYYPNEMSQELLKKYFNLKYACSGPNTAGKAADANTSQAEVYMRLSEVILMKAEAELQSGNEGAAATTLDALIGARSNSAYTTATYPWPAGVTTMMQKIQLQWRIEYWAEVGYEYYNNKRWNIGVDRKSAGPTGIASSHVDNLALNPVAPGVAFTFRIPMVELNSNPACEQNP